ncbi:hypothetical protein PHMEG_00026649, partial [Phytophthora megakarya]
IRHSPGASGAPPLAALRGAEPDLGDALVLKLQHRAICLSPERTLKFRPHRAAPTTLGPAWMRAYRARNAVGSRELATVNSPRPAAPPASSGDAGTRPSGTPDALVVGPNTARAVEQPVALPAAFGNADTNPVSVLTARNAGQPVAATHSEVRETALTTRSPPGPSATQIPWLRLHPTVAVSLRSFQDSDLATTLVPQPRHSAVQVRMYVATQVQRWMGREPGVVPPPDPYYPDRHHWPMRNWLPEKKETIRHHREIVRPWTANFRSECLCLPVVADPLALQVDLEELRFADGARDFTSVIAVL